MHSYRQIESIQRRVGAVIDDLLTASNRRHTATANLRISIEPDSTVRQAEITL
jgi:hypothetical protein